MTKRVISAFSLVICLSLLLDFTHSQLSTSNVSAPEISYESADASATAGVIAASAVDLAELEDEAAATIAESEAIATAASIGAIYGFENIAICNVDSGNLNVRETADPDGKLVGKFPKNAAGEIIGTEGEWTKIESGNVTGYVLTEYLLTGDEGWAKASELAEYVATAKTGGLRIRQEPSTECTVLDTLGEGEEVTIIEQGDEWIKVDLDGEEAYVAAEYVDIDLSLTTAMTLTEARYGVGVSDVGTALCDYALQFVGNPYVWGGTSLTNGADCSGFVMQVFAHYGISLPHSSKAQSTYGTKVDFSELQPGDVIFYGSGKSISHVAIYIGGGQIVHASNKRTGIKVSSASYRTPIKCIRLL